MMRSKMLLAILATMSATPFASAQNPQPAPPGARADPVAPPNAPLPPPEQLAPRQKDPGAGNQTPSDKLSQENGVLQPPHDVDPGLTVNPPAQSGQSMTVIPPPGSPGGNRRGVPK